MRHGRHDPGVRAVPLLLVRSRAHRLPSASPAGSERDPADAEGARDRDRGVLHQMPRESGDAPDVSGSMAQRHGASGRQKELVADGGSVALPGVRATLRVSSYVAAKYSASV